MVSLTEMGHMLNPQQLKFIDLYLDPTNKETYSNGKASALAAGYSAKRAAVSASCLLRNKGAVAEIEKRRLNLSVKTERNKEYAILEAWRNYETTHDGRVRKQWFDMWVSLQGWLVQKTESTSKVEFTKEENVAIDNAVREYFEKNSQAKIGNDIDNLGNPSAP
jgi:hypothetical protein